MKGNTVLDEVDEVQADLATEQSLSTREQLTERLHRVQAAIERLDRAEYGRCIECGQPIAGRPGRSRPPASRAGAGPRSGESEPARPRERRAERGTGARS